MVVESTASASLMTIRVVLGEVDVSVHGRYPDWQVGRSWQKGEQVVGLRLGTETLALGQLFVHGGQVLIRVTQVKEFPCGAVSASVSPTVSSEGV
jgi:hypothetical protein